MHQLKNKHHFSGRPYVSPCFKSSFKHASFNQARAFRFLSFVLMFFYISSSLLTIPGFSREANSLSNAGSNIESNIESNLQNQSGLDSKMPGRGLFSIFKRPAPSGFKVLMAGFLFEQPGNTFYIKTLKNQEVKVISKKTGKLRKYTGKHVFIKGNILNANTDNEYLEIKKIKMLKADEITELERMYKNVDSNAFRYDQKPSQLINKSNDIYKVSNIRWDHEPPRDDRPGISVTKDTVIDTLKIKRVLFILEPFAPEYIAAHSMLFFEMDPQGVTCIDSAGKKLKSSGIVFSMEAFLEKGDSYDLKKGLGKNFRNIMQLCTLEDRYNMTLAKRGHKLRPFELNLNKTQQQNLLKAALDFACLDHNAEFYNTYVKNCTNTLIQLINLVVEPKRAIPEWILPKIFYNPRATVPVLVPSYLKRKDLVKAELPVILPENYTDLKRAYSIPVK